MQLEHAKGGFDDVERERLEHQVRPKPHELRTPTVQRRLERTAPLLPRLAVDAVGADNEVEARRLIVERRRGRSKVQFCPELGSPRLQDVQQLLAAEGGESVAA